MEHKISIASYPFNKANADVILRSSDNVDFHVHQVILGLASDFMEDMFSLPQSLTSNKDLPVVEVTEESETLDHLLRLIYPTQDPVLEDIMAVGRVLKAAIKYQMDIVTARLRGVLTVYVDPLRLYTIACGTYLEQEAKSAVLEWCDSSDLNLESYVPEMDEISAGAYYRALQFYSMFKGEQMIPDSFTFCIPNTGSSVNSPAHTGSFPAAESVTIPSPFDKPSVDSNVIIRSASDQVDLYVNQAILTLASEKLANMVQSSDQCEGGHRIILLPESGRVLVPLFSFIYPISFPHFEERGLLIAVLKAAVKYELGRALEIVRSRWRHDIQIYPLQSYFFAMQNGWDEDARVAAKFAAILPLDEYIPQMETVDAGVYRRFLQYRKRWRSIISAATQVAFYNIYEPPESNYDVFWSEQAVLPSSRLERQIHVAWAHWAGAMLPRATTASLTNVPGTAVTGSQDTWMQLTSLINSCSYNMIKPSVSDVLRKCEECVEEIHRLSLSDELNLEV
ncbi:uncharacterized protein FIBRA_08119 [Fibroporia radiculosa]|uniref:BTB domain-containing protein n=1 Tax=Fibroporia radiculosa TaxID=599839 RepID=J4I278_9APHY|nr:uncharacterized protein FIBRA_08119 [Fibroporia radiculosa]CCM05882.1 predicted protein [Fibroporia radiculosa]